MGDALLARAIGIVQLLEGPLSAPPEGGRFKVMGQPVLLLPDAQVQEGARPLQPGDTVKVSGMLARGHWDGRVLRIEETRMDPSLRFADRVSNVVLEAVVSGRLDDGSLNGCGLQVVSAAAARLRGLTASEVLDVRRVRMTGRIAPDGRFVAEELDGQLRGQPVPVR